MPPKKPETPPAPPADNLKTGVEPTAGAGPAEQGQTPPPPDASADKDTASQPPPTDVKPQTKKSDQPEVRVKLDSDVEEGYEEINGVKFERVVPKKAKPYWLSVPVSSEVAERFARIPGYSVVE